MYSTSKLFLFYDYFVICVIILMMSIPPLPQHRRSYQFTQGSPEHKYNSAVQRIP